MKRPTNNVYTFPKLQSPAPTMKNTLFIINVNFLPFNSEGLFPIIHPIQAPKIAKEVATWASTVQIITSGETRYANNC